MELLADRATWPKRSRPTLAHQDVGPASRGHFELDVRLPLCAVRARDLPHGAQWRQRGEL